MDIMGPFRTDPTATAASTEAAAIPANRFVVVETDEHEEVVFAGASQDEVDAKLDDFLTWAS